MRAASSTGCGLPPIFLARRAAGEVFERAVRHVGVFADLEDPDDIRVLDRGDGLGLGLESSEVLRAMHLPGADHLECDEAIEPDLPAP